MSRPVDQVAFPSNTDCCKDIIPCAHNVADRSLIQLVDDSGRAQFQLVLKNDEADEVKF